MNHSVWSMETMVRSHTSAGTEVVDRLDIALYLDLAEGAIH